MESHDSPHPEGCPEENLRQKPFVTCIIIIYADACECAIDEYFRHLDLSLGTAMLLLHCIQNYRSLPEEFKHILNKIDPLACSII